MRQRALGTRDWAIEQFRDCQFGDVRRTKRLIGYANRVAMKPQASTPEQATNWADLKAAYRLFDHAEVTFAAVTAPHQRKTRNPGPGTWLIINDLTELDFGYQRQLPGFGRVGKGRSGHFGFLLHNALLVSPDSGEIVGLAAQDLSTRSVQKILRPSSSTRRKQRSRETDYWGRVIDAIGPAPPSAYFVHVCDRGADNFDVYAHCVSQQAGWLIRAAQLHRLVINHQQQRVPIQKLLDTAPVCGRYEVDVRATKKQPARTAQVEIRFTRLSMPAPHAGSPYIQQSQITEIPMCAIAAREINPPAGCTPLNWVLYTSEEVADYATARQLLKWYEKRWLIEEYHKCLKTGCRVEERQYHTADRLAPVIGLLSIMAVRLLQLKLIARIEPERPAIDVVPASWVAALPKLMKKRLPVQTVRQFMRALAQFGGFLARKCDGEPGWQTIWRGLEKLLLCLDATEYLKHSYG